MDELTSSLASIHFSPEPSPEPPTYLAIFNTIVEFAAAARRSPIPAAELAITTQLAGPFTPGGLLILLEEPRPIHPWDSGFDSVVEDCKTLDLLETWIGLGSKGSMSLAQNVAVLDSRPLLVAKEHPNLGEEEWSKLYGLVLKAIEAKRPDVVLCMGRVASDVLSNWAGAHVIRTKHPGYYINHNREEQHERLDLFKSIVEACHRTKHGIWYDHSWPLVLENSTTYSPPPPSEPLSLPLDPVADAPRLVHCLGILMKLCFKPLQILPAHTIHRDGPFYAISPRLSDWLTGTTRRASHVDPHVRARARLIPVFVALNRCVVGTSLYRPVFKVNWAGVYAALQTLGAEFEDACYLLARGEEGGEGSVEVARGGHGGRDVSTLLGEFERVLLRAEVMWQSVPHLPRTKRYWWRVG